MNYLIFDTETESLPKDWKAPMSDLDNWPRCIQLAWIVADQDGTELKRQKHLIKPVDFKIPTEAFWVQHGFTQEESEKNGIAIGFVLDQFLEDLKDCSAIVSHNMSFDYAVVGSECIRAGKRHEGPRLFQICTKEFGTDLCRIPFAGERFVPKWKQRKDRGYKWPTLSELHNYLFKKDFENAHDALADVIACRDCFFEMVKRGVIEFETVTT